MRGMAANYGVSVTPPGTYDPNVMIALTTQVAYLPSYVARYASRRNETRVGTPTLRGM